MDLGLKRLLGKDFNPLFPSDLPTDSSLGIQATSLHFVTKASQNRVSKKAVSENRGRSLADWH
jgi:hypothetical protein